MNSAIREIQDDMVKQVEFFNSIEKPLEAKRLQERTELDLEMIKELGYCSGIENYSRYMDGREPGTRPFCLLDYFPKDYLMVIDESHATLPVSYTHLDVYKRQDENGNVIVPDFKEWTEHEQKKIRENNNPIELNHKIDYK